MTELEENLKNDPTGYWTINQLKSLKHHQECIAARYSMLKLSKEKSGLELQALNRIYESFDSAQIILKSLWQRHHPDAAIDCLQNNEKIDVKEWRHHFSV